MPDTSQLNQVFQNKTLESSHEASSSTFNKSYAFISIGVCMAITLGAVFCIMPKLAAQKKSMLLTVRGELNNSKIDMQEQIIQDAQIKTKALEEEIAKDELAITLIKDRFSFQLNKVNEELYSVREQAIDQKTIYEKEAPAIEAEIAQLGVSQEVLAAKNKKITQIKEIELNTIINSRHDEINKELANMTKNLQPDSSKSFLARGLDWVNKYK